jgi:hypothetical protein
VSVSTFPICFIIRHLLAAEQEFTCATSEPLPAAIRFRRYRAGSFAPAASSSTISFHARQLAVVLVELELLAQAGISDPLERPHAAQTL